MKKILLGVALLFAVSMTQAASHNDEQNISSTKLPAALQSDIKTSYADYWITDLKEEGEGRHAKYFLTLENADQVIHLKAGKENTWEIVNTTVKLDA